MELVLNLNSINWSAPTWDLFIILFFVVAAFIYGLSLGRDRIIVILVSIYMAYAVAMNTPYLEKTFSNINTGVGINGLFLIKIASFVLIFLALFFLLSRSALMKTIAASAGTSGSWWQVILFSFLHVGLLISISLSFLPATITSQLAPLTKDLFVSNLARFLWIVAPIVVMVLMRGPKKTKGEIEE